MDKRPWWLAEDGKRKWHKPIVRVVNKKSRCWELLSYIIRYFYKKCQWCEKEFDNISLLHCHHILCGRYNWILTFDTRIILCVCQPCHRILEPYSKVHADQYLPQLFE